MEMVSSVKVLDFPPLSNALGKYFIPVTLVSFRIKRSAQWKLGFFTPYYRIILLQTWVPKEVTSSARCLTVRKWILCSNHLVRSGTTFIWWFACQTCSAQKQYNRQDSDPGEFIIRPQQLNDHNSFLLQVNLIPFNQPERVYKRRSQEKENYKYVHGFC